MRARACAHTIPGVSEHGIGVTGDGGGDTAQRGGGGGISCIFITQGNFLPTFVKTFVKNVVFKHSLTTTFQQSACRPHADYNYSSSLSMWSVTTSTQHYVCGNCQKVYTSQGAARSCTCTRKYA